MPTHLPREYLPQRTRELSYGKSLAAEPSCQQSLFDARSVLVGADGSERGFTTFLTMMGIGQPILVDGETVELSNLSRQNRYFPLDLGHDRVTVLAQRLRVLNLLIDSQGVHIDMSSSADADARVSDYHPNVVVSCGDLPSPNQVFSWLTMFGDPVDLPHMEIVRVVTDAASPQLTNPLGVWDWRRNAMVSRDVSPLSDAQRTRDRKAAVE